MKTFQHEEIGCRDKANCPHVKPWLLEKCPPWGAFLKDLSPYLREFRRKPRKALKVRSTSATDD